MIKLPYLIIIMIILSNDLLSQPKDIDYILAYGGLAIVAANQLFLDKFAPTEPSWNEPNSFDLYFRNKLKWSDINMTCADNISDALAWSMLIFSTFGAPSIGDLAYNQHLLINLQVLAATGIVVGATKYLIARQRPYAHFEIDAGLNKSKDNLSFFSGHTAFAFATATSSSMMLQEKYNHNSGVIWSSALTVAAITGILRIAAERHYMTDVLSGAIVGTLIAYIITKNQKSRFSEKQESSTNLLYNWSFSF